MSNALMIPEASAIPEYILNPELAKQQNADAAAGLSLGASARIKMSGKQFVLVDGNGEEKPVKAGEMTVAEDGNAYLPVVILNAKKHLSKTFYANKYNPDEEGAAPDCFSNDGIAPDESVNTKQCDSCAACPHNAFGSGTDANGNATGGKACTDNKILAVFCKGKVYKLKITPASLKNAGLYIKELTARGIPLGNVKTLLGFDESKSFPVMTFQFGGFIDQKVLPQLAEMSQGMEAMDIVNERMTASTKALPEKPAEKKTAPAPKKAAPAPAPAPKVEDDLGLGGIEEAVIVEQAEVPDASVVDLAKELGL